MAKKHMKRCSTSLSIRQTQLKIIMRYHFKLVRMVIFKKSTNHKQWKGVEKGILLHCWWACKLIQASQRIVWRFLKKEKVKLPYDPAIELLGIYTKKKKKKKGHNSKGHIHPNIHHSTIDNSQDMEAPKCPPTDEWIKKIQYIYTVHFSSVQLLSRIQLFVTPWTAAHQASCPSPTHGVCSDSCPSSQ